MSRPGNLDNCKDAHEYIIEIGLVEILSTQAACHFGHAKDSGCPWITLYIPGDPWISMGIYGYLWIPMDPMDINRYPYPWKSMDVLGYPLTSMDVHKYP